MRVIAHRGASARAPENTLAAFAAAISDGADGIECDARLTLDDVVVLMHDDDVARTTNGTGRVSEMSFEQLRAMHARGEHVPTLQEMLDLVAGRIAIVVEVKGAFGGARIVQGADVARAVLPLIESVPSVLVSSFDPAAIALVRALATRVPTAITIGGYSDLDEALALAIDVGHAEIHIPAERADATFIARAHESGRAVCAYTVNDAVRARVLEAMEIDGIFSDDPAGVRVR
ncbi:MAG: glycerophosphodiester phosphodiesterase [Actinomycetota bacterium]